jgi:hypothetical protein
VIAVVSAAVRSRSIVSAPKARDSLAEDVDEFGDVVRTPTDLQRSQW